GEGIGEEIAAAEIEHGAGGEIDGGGGVAPIGVSEVAAEDAAFHVDLAGEADHGGVRGSAEEGGAAARFAQLAAAGGGLRVVPTAVLRGGVHFQRGGGADLHGAVVRVRIREFQEAGIDDRVAGVVGTAADGERARGGFVKAGGTGE